MKYAHGRTYVLPLLPNYFNVGEKYHGSHGCLDISLKTTNVYFVVVLEEKSGYYEHIVPRMSIQKIIAIQPIVVIFQSGPVWLID